ncbi:hypothetical protein [Agrococcus sp. TSP3-2-1]|uniref:hypothetical protein n=1 Tax=Agrococcus sp. TSP3-2-1 TaxID=2804583 RepID=UPI003CE82ACC
MRRALGALAATLAVVAGTTGCGFGAACTAVGYSSTLHVELGSAADGIAALEVCPEAGCGVEGEPEIGAGRVTVGDELATFMLYDPGERLRLRALGEDGAVLTEAVVQPDWVRVGGTERCGGPTEATVQLAG